MEVNLTGINDKELTDVFTWMEKQFDPREIKPLSRIRTFIQSGNYDARIINENGAMKGYVLTAYANPSRGRLIDYLAILPDYQDQGYGSALLRALQRDAKASPVFLEVENPDAMRTEEEKKTALRRIAFYEKNGCRMTSIRLELFDVDFCIMVVNPDCTLDDMEIRARLDEVYHMFFPPAIYQKKVLFR